MPWLARPAARSLRGVGKGGVWVSAMATRVRAWFEPSWGRGAYLVCVGLVTQSSSGQWPSSCHGCASNGSRSSGAPGQHRAHLPRRCARGQKEPAAVRVRSRPTPRGRAATSSASGSTQGLSATHTRGVRHGIWDGCQPHVRRCHGSIFVAVGNAYLQGRQPHAWASPREAA